jgi:nucleotide-binding universal stress UspA family protein
MKIQMMEKILVAVNVLQFNKEVIEFACYVAQLTSSNLVGLFLENLQEEDGPGRKTLFGNPYIETIVSEDIIENRKRKKMCEESMNLFKHACERREVRCLMLRKPGRPEEEIQAETRYADLLIMDAEMTFGELKEAVPTHFVRDLLERSECSVLIVPFHFYGIQDIVFAYDAKESSAYAIKQFTYLFPELQNKRLTVLHVAEHEMMPEQEKLKLTEYLEMHYDNITFAELHGKPADEIFGYLLQKNDAFVVMGAFSSKILANLFRKSTATLVLEAVNLPVFVAHR